MKTRRPELIRFQPAMSKVANRRMVRIYGGVAVFLLVLASNIEAKKPKSIVVSLDAKWAQTGLLAETSEFLYQEGNQHFWTLLDSIVESPQAKQLGEFSDQQVYEFSIREAKKLLGPVGAARVDLLKFALSLRVHSPAVELHRQLGAGYPQAAKCAMFVDVHGQVSCNVADIEELVKNVAGRPTPHVFASDHHFPGSKGAPILVVLYGSLLNQQMHAAHKKLGYMAEKRQIDYVFRHYEYLEEKETRQVRLSGYGVELAIKSTEYKAQDDSKIKANVTASGGVVEEDENDEEDLHGFNFKELKKLHPDLRDNLNELKTSLYEADELAPLKVWQLQDLSFQAAQRVINAKEEDALDTLRDISQNFPLLAHDLTRQQVKPELRREIEANQGKWEDVGVSAGETALFINGLLIELDSLDVYQLLDMLKKEEKLAAGFFSMGYRREYLTLLTALDLRDDQASYAIDYREALPDYLNNLETDPEYKDWGNSVQMMIQPYFPGMIRPIARNFYTLLFIVDPSTRAGFNLMKIAYSFYSHQIPIRIGLSFVVNTDRSVAGYDNVGVALLNLYNFIKDDTGRSSKGLRAINDVFAITDDWQDLDVQKVIKQFKRMYKDEDPDLVFGANSDYDNGRQAGTNFLKSSGLGFAPKVLLNGVPLDDGGLTADRFEETVINTVMKVTPRIQRAIMEGKLQENQNVAKWIMEQPDVMPRLNPRVLQSDKTTAIQQRSKFLDLTDVMEYNARSLKEFKDLTEKQQNEFILQRTKYLKRSPEPKCYPLTVWVVADVETVKGRELVYSAIRHLKHSHHTRIALIHNPSKTPDPKGNAPELTKLVEGGIKLLNDVQSKQFVTKLVKEENVKLLADGKTTIEDLAVHEMNVASFNKELNIMSDEFLALHAYYATKVLELQPGQRAVVANGQIFGPLDSNEEFDTEDFMLLEKYVMARHASVIAKQMDVWNVAHDNDKCSDLVARTSALVMSDPIPKRRHWVVMDNDKHSVVTLTAPSQRSANFDVMAIVDPLSRDAQKVAHMLNILKQVTNADIQLAMNCKAKLSEMPLKNFYRLVVEPELQFTSEGQLRPSPVARFTSLPQKQLLTLNVSPPDNWMVEAVRAFHDLDNIKMEMVDGDIVAQFELEHLLLEGHCYDEVTGQPPRGLQFKLNRPQNEEEKVDTIVMANLGYFQLKANPGAWVLQLREGRSAEIYDITTHTNTDSPPHEDEVSVLLDSFTSKVIRIRVQKKHDKLDANLLSDGTEEKDEEGGLWDTISSTISGGKKEAHETINIFSLASGHLYERFMRIMMISVLKNTKHPVKFWLLKNYLSPYFKQFLPYMAEHYNFKYEFVQYKWPRWLHQQTEKQRVMWGYKILFLDVLFPLDVKKIIFVDADQTVRTDLMELMEFPLDGAPYGYTPFCDSRKEMDGFRFWKQGYWNNHLGGRKYHISALYVVDLKRFRQIAAGDRLRGQYQGLSADPNSLSNLDQDLPNNMIHQVKIKTLPQEWLWCETWCDDSSKKSAKTIDLCNNPQTKEPKLEAAMRIVPEWTENDNAIKKLQERYDQGLPAHDTGDSKPAQETKHQHDEV